MVGRVAAQEQNEVWRVNTKRSMFKTKESGLQAHTQKNKTGVINDPLGQTHSLDRQ